MNMKKAIQVFGSKSSIAKVLGITRPAVSRWGNEIPQLRQYQLLEIIEKSKQVAAASKK